MKLNQLCPSRGSTKSKKRLGRGIGSGSGKTCGRGVKGQKSRSGVAINGFEGGQMPIYRRLPKRGFVNIFSKEYNEISLGRIQQAIDSGKLDASEVITAKVLQKASIIKKIKNGIRLLSNGEIKTAVNFEISGASAAAISKIQKIGGNVSIKK